jgi:hypothetical protein
MLTNMPIGVLLTMPTNTSEGQRMISNTRILILGLVGSIFMLACTQKPTAAAICKKIESTGIGKNCSKVKPAVINARAKTKFDFDLVRVPGEKGAVLDFESDADYSATVEAYAAAAMLAGPHRYGNPSTRIFIQMNSGVSLEDGNAVKALVSGDVAPPASSLEPAASPSASVAPVPANPRTLMLASAKDLYDAYQKNEVAADEKYKGKRLAVFGLIASIEKDALEHMLVKIKAGNELADVVAQMRESEKPKVVQLEKNKKVYVLCEGAGMVLQTPMLDNCNISSVAEVNCLLDEEFVALEKNIIVERTKRLLDASSEQRELAAAEANVAKCRAEAARP